MVKYMLDNVRKITSIIILMVLLGNLSSCSKLTEDNFLNYRDLACYIMDCDSVAIYENWSEELKQNDTFEENLNLFFYMLDSYKLTYDVATIHKDSGGASKKYRNGRCSYDAYVTQIKDIFDENGNQYQINISYINVCLDNEQQVGINSIILIQCDYSESIFEPLLFIGKTTQMSEFEGEEGFFIYN